MGTEATRLRVSVWIVALLFLIVLLVSSSLIFTPVVSASNATLPSNPVTPQKDSIAGYEVFSSSGGSTVSTQAKWTVPTVNCTSSSSVAFMQFYVTVGHITAEDSGSQLVATCSGTTPQYSFSFFAGSKGGNQIPAQFTISPGDMMQTFASESISTGATKVTIRDLTLGWLFTNSSMQTVDKTRSSFAWWIVAEPGGGVTTRPLLQFSDIKVSGIKATVGGHNGILGSFIPISKITVYKEIFVDTSTNHVLAKPTSITSTSTSFTIKWIQGS